MFRVYALGFRVSLSQGSLSGFQGLERKIQGVGMGIRT